MVWRLGKVHGPRGEKAPRAGRTPMGGTGSGWGKGRVPSARFENRLRRKSRPQYPPMAANRMPPSGRKRMHAPMERPHPSHIADDPFEAELSTSRRVANPHTAKSRANVVKNISSVSVRPAAAYLARTRHSAASRN